jgi:hypothetical protein
MVVMSCEGARDVSAANPRTIASLISLHRRRVINSDQADCLLSARYHARGSNGTPRRPAQDAGAFAAAAV